MIKRCPGARPDATIFSTRTDIYCLKIYRNTGQNLPETLEVGPQMEIFASQFFVYPRFRSRFFQVFVELHCSI